MPQERFSKDFNGQKFSIELIDLLKDKYNVSRTACAFRFADVGNHDIMIIYAENGKIRWKYCSDRFPTNTCCMRKMWRLILLWENISNIL